MNLFKVFLTKKSDDFEKCFQRAFQDIYALTKKMCLSKNERVQNYIFPGYDNKPWLSYDEKAVFIDAEMPSVIISKYDAFGCDKLEYDFGKRAPADDGFLFAVMSIFHHHVPETEFFSEVYAYDDSFDDGVLLARLVNDKIKNPFTGKVDSIERLVTSPYIKKVYNALVLECDSAKL